MIYIHKHGRIRGIVALFRAWDVMGHYYNAFEHNQTATESISLGIRVMFQLFVKKLVVTGFSIVKPP